MAAPVMSRRDLDFLLWSARTQRNPCHEPLRGAVRPIRVAGPAHGVPRGGLVTGRPHDPRHPRGGLSLRNDVVLVSLTHKMGTRGTTNTLLSFGDGTHARRVEKGAVGMNEACRKSVQYATMRTQGRTLTTADGERSRFPAPARHPHPVAKSWLSHVVLAWTWLDLVPAPRIRLDVLARHDRAALDLDPHCL